MGNRTISVLDTGAVANTEQLQTAAFQKALDTAFEWGGATVTVPAGKYRIGGLRLRSNTTLHLLSGAQLYGSRDVQDYCILPDQLEPLPEAWCTDKCWEPFVKGVQRCYDFMKPGGRWGNALIRAIGAENVAIIGEKDTLLDGRDCYDELGEEKYRGPHGISMHHCRNITLKGYTIANTGNWAHCIFDSENLHMDGVTAIAGHDGIHMTSCRNMVIENSEFYTGDDCVAGFANVNVAVSHCACNTACSGMRFGGTNAYISDCRFFGPAKYFFRGSLSLEEKISGARAHMPHRTNMLSVFTYYADFSVDIPVAPGNIVIENCTVSNVDRFLHYNFSGNERWQSHRPLRSVRFENITADGIRMPLTAYGSPDTPLDLALANVSVTFDPAVENTAFLHAAYYDRIVMENVRVDKKPDAPLIKSWTKGGETVMRNVSYEAPEQEMLQYTEEPFVCKSI